MSPFVPSQIFKYDGAGNDFLAFDARSIEFDEMAFSEVVPELCHRRRGIGADGIIVLRNPTRGVTGVDFRMLYYNADGSTGEMCGNGARCLVKFAHDLGVIGSSTRFETGAGIYSADLVEHGRIRLHFPEITTKPSPINFQGETVDWNATFQIVGVPHTVIPVVDTTKVNLPVDGARLRRHSATGPRGTNVNFVSFEPGNNIRIRTFECGVEDETLACGTGCVASALSRAWREGKTGPCQYDLHTVGGDVMTIEFVLGETGATQVSLTGPAVRVFQAQWLKHR